MFSVHERVLGHLNRGPGCEPSGLATSLSVTRESVFSSGYLRGRPLPGQPLRPEVEGGHRGSSRVSFLKKNQLTAILVAKGDTGG